MDADPDPYCNTGKTCLGGDMHSNSASRLLVHPFVHRRNMLPSKR